MDSEARSTLNTNTFFDNDDLVCRRGPPRLLSSFLCLLHGYDGPTVEGRSTHEHDWKYFASYHCCARWRMAMLRQLFFFFCKRVLKHRSSPCRNTFLATSFEVFFAIHRSWANDDHEELSVFDAHSSFPPISLHSSHMDIDVRSCKVMRAVFVDARVQIAAVRLFSIVSVFFPKCSRIEVDVL